jgi:hypothetical protein
MLSLEQIYRVLVPQQAHDALHNVGVIGGISMTVSFLQKRSVTIFDFLSTTRFQTSPCSFCIRVIVKKHFQASNQMAR